MTPTPPLADAHESRRGPTAAVAAPAVLALVLAAAWTSPLAGRAAHEEAVLETPASTVAAAGEMRLTGREFAAGEEHRLRLVGPLEEHDLGGVTPDSAGTFERSLRLPAEAGPGRYQLVAVAPDGDVAARLSLTVVSSSAAGGRDGSGSDTADDGREAGGAAAGARSAPAERRATAEEMEIERTRSGAEWAVITLLLVASGGLGVGLVRRGRRGR